jgi:hypothetical protein
MRTRRGYRGLTADALLVESGAKLSALAPVSDSAANLRAPFRIRTASWYAPEGGGTAAVWIVGELDYATRRQLAWTSGATADVTVVSGEGVEVVSRAVPVASGEGGFSVSLAGAGGLRPGDYAVRVRLQPASTAGAPLTDSFRLVIPGRPTPLGDAVLLRRGPSTGPRHVVTADPRFQRSERIRVEMASTPGGSPSARMLDRLGNPMQVPVQVSSRLDASGAFRWIAVDASLAPLAAGDYAIEVTLDGAVGSVDFSVVP